MAPPCPARPPERARPPVAGLALWGHAAALCPAAAPPPRRAADAPPAMAQDAAPPGRAAPLRLVLGTRRWRQHGRAYATRPAAARARGHHDGPASRMVRTTTPASTSGATGRHAGPHDRRLWPRLLWSLRQTGVAALTTGTQCVSHGAVIPGLLFLWPRQATTLRPATQPLINGSSCPNKPVVEAFSGTFACLDYHGHFCYDNVCSREIFRHFCLRRILNHS